MAATDEESKVQAELDGLAKDLTHGLHRSIVMGATCDICKRPKSHGDVLLTVQRDKDAPAFTMCGECWIEWTPAPKRVAAVDTKKAKQRRVAVEIVDWEE